MTSGSSKQWLRRQSKDTYAAKAGVQGYASRAAFKLEQIIEKQKFLKALLVAGTGVVDLGAAPGGWSELVQRNYHNSLIVAVDRVPMHEGGRLKFIQGDIAAVGLAAQVLTALGKRAGVVLCDCSPDLMGHRATDQIRSEQLALAAFELAQGVLAQGGVFLVKLRQGGTAEIEAEVRARFKKVGFQKPKASRSESAETYLLGCDFVG